MLGRWIPKEKRANNKEQITNNGEQIINIKEQITKLSIPGVDTAKGIAMTGGKEERYRSLLALLCKDVEERLPLLQKTEEADLSSMDTISSLVTQFHALKGASANLGAETIAAEAAALEAAGKAGDIEFIGKQLPLFIELLTAFVKDIHDSPRL